MLLCVYSSVGFEGQDVKTAVVGVDGCGEGFRPESPPCEGGNSGAEYTRAPPQGCQANKGHGVGRRSRRGVAITFE